MKMLKMEMIEKALKKIEESSACKSASNELHQTLLNVGVDGDSDIDESIGNILSSNVIFVVSCKKYPDNVAADLFSKVVRVLNAERMAILEK